MENSFKSVVDKSKSILILLPTKPFFDQVAAGLSLYLSLRGEKNVQIASPSPMIVEFNRLIGINKISQELGNKNLIIRFRDYKANDIERVSYDIENGEFKLSVIPKQKSTPPDKNQIELSYSGISADTVILVGGANESHFPALSEKELSGAELVHIGLRDLSMSGGRKYISFSRPASSASELVYTLIKESGMNLDQDIASNLVMGIEVGSDGFMGEGVAASTFTVIAELMKLGGKRLSQIPQPQPQTYPPGAIPGQTPQAGAQQQPQVQAQGTTPTTQAPQDQGQQTVDGKNGGQDQKAPQDWLEPKIFKGTSTS
jgi:hypothetical protein